MPQYTNLQEEELKIRIAEQFFAAFDCGTRIGKIDFCVTQPLTRRNTNKSEATPINSLLWAEAKRGTVTDIYKPLVQLVLTIGKARTFDTYLPPPFLAAFDAEKIAFLPYREILPFLALNDFNWNVLRLILLRANLDCYTPLYAMFWIERRTSFDTMPTKKSCESL